MTRDRQRLSSLRRIRLFLVAFALFALVIGPAAVKSTVAGWKDSDSGTGAFSAGTLEPVRDLKCINQGVGGLLTKKVKLEWSAPKNPSPVPSLYQITVMKNGTLNGTFKTNQLNFMYTDNNLVRISNYVLTVQQTTISGEWTSTANSANATGISILLGLTMICGKAK